jgi:hypothetical protein
MAMTIPTLTDYSDPDNWDIDDDEECDCDQDPESWESACIDDMCHGGEVPCMHGSYARLPCLRCGK